MSEPDIEAADGRLALAIEPGCILTLTTTTGQTKGRTSPPAPTPFPARYAEDFESYPTGAMPRYFADQAGIFEVARKSGGRGKVLRQVIERKGIEWPFHLNPPPETFLGDANWQDYAVGVDARLDGPGFVVLFGRVGQVPQNANPPDGYSLKIDADGWWELGTAKIPLASGRARFSAGSWHRLELRFAGESIAARMDGRELIVLRDRTYPAGLAGIGCGWHRAEFDNLGIATEPGDADLAFGCAATASSIWDVDHAAGNVTDGNPVGTRWSAASGRSGGEWVAIDFGRTITFDRVDVRQHEERITAYTVQWWDGQGWKDACAGPALGAGLRRLTFEPVTSSRLRFFVKEAKSTPSLVQIEVRNRRGR
jgi:hypothetical protein